MNDILSFSFVSDAYQQALLTRAYNAASNFLDLHMEALVDKSKDA